MDIWKDPFEEEDDFTMEIATNPEDPFGEKDEEDEDKEFDTWWEANESNIDISF